MKRFYVIGSNEHFGFGAFSLPMTPQEREVLANFLRRSIQPSVSFEEYLDYVVSEIDHEDKAFVYVNIEDRVISGVEMEDESVKALSELAERFQQSNLFATVGDLLASLHAAVLERAAWRNAPTLPPGRLIQ